MTAGRAGRAAQRRAAAAARRHRRGDRPPAEPADDHLRLRPRAVRARRGRSVRARLAAAAVAAPVRRRCPPRRSTRRSPAATSASRRAPTTRRSPSTRSATSPGSAAGRWCMKWSQLGFGRTSTTTREQDTPAQPDGAQGRDQQHPGRGHRRRSTSSSGSATRDRPWLRGGTYLVTRRIRMLIESWDRTALAEQERTIGRAQVLRRAADGTDEFDTADFEARGPEGPVIDRDAHVRLSSGDLLGTQDPAPRLLVHRRLRRGHRTARRRASSSSASSATRTSSSASSATSPGDILNEYIVHTSSAVFAVPPGATRGRATSARRCSPDGESVRPRPPPAGRPAGGPGAGDRVRVRPRGPGSRP